MKFLAPIVEGHGEVEAVPILLHRIASAVEPNNPIRVNRPIRVKAGSFLNDAGYFEKYVTLASGKAAQENGSVLMILDCEDQCPAHLGPRLLAQAQAVRLDANYFVVLASREYESWFLAAAASLSGINGLPNQLVSPANAEEIRDAKGWLGKQMTGRYDPITHQSEFTREFDLEQACANHSFARLYRFVSTI
jgi:hypothetical protein